MASYTKTPASTAAAKKAAKREAVERLTKQNLAVNTLYNICMGLRKPVQEVVAAGVSTFGENVNSARTPCPAPDFQISPVRSISSHFPSPPLVPVSPQVKGYFWCFQLTIQNTKV